MFDNSRYLTKGINEEVPLNLQILLWSMIDSTLIKKDYLQVFKIKIINKNANLSEMKNSISDLSKRIDNYNNLSNEEKAKFFNEYREYFKRD
jgi:hypothetical protein